MEEDPLDISDNSPTWRWEYIKSLTDNGKMPSRRPEDAVFVRGYRFMKRMQPGKFFDIQAVKRDYPTLAPAHFLWRNTGSERWIVEAGLLTNASFKDIGDYVAQPEEVIDQYRLYYFDVKEKLASQGYIINRVLTPSGFRNMGHRDYDFMYKSLAYYLGWDAFKEFIGSQDYNDKLRTSLVNNFRNSLLSLGLKAVKCAPLNSYTAIPIIEQCLKMIDAEATREHGSMGDRSEAISLMGALLNQCKVTILPYSEQLELNEPRALEMVHSARPQLQYGDPIPIEGDQNGRDKQTG